MKIYKPKFWTRLFVISGIILIFIIGGLLVLIFDKEVDLFISIVIFVGIIFGIAGSYALFSLKVGIDEGKLTLLNTIDIRPLFLGKRIQRINPSLRWDEIGELHTNYILFPETANVILKPKEGLNKRRIEFIVGVGGMPIELLKDILSHLSPNTKVYLYPYLKRKLEGKQIWFYLK